MPRNFTSHDVVAQVHRLKSGQQRPSTWDAARQRIMASVHTLQGLQLPPCFRDGAGKIAMLQIYIFEGGHGRPSWGQLSR